MTQTLLAAERGGAEVPAGRTVVVGVKLDSRSRELLTWALVKVAQPGDSVVALHVLGDNGMVLLLRRRVEGKNERIVDV